MRTPQNNHKRRNHNSSRTKRDSSKNKTKKQNKYNRDDTEEEDNDNDDEEDDDDDEEEKEENEDNEGGKSSNIRQNKGLKILSIVVKEIVKKKKETTYKEVAEIIIKDNLRFENRGIVDSDKYKKQEQNIKRRVYDALNVLISASILKKDRKSVRLNEHRQEIFINHKRDKINILNSLIVRLTRNKEISQSKKRNFVWII